MEKLPTHEQQICSGTYRFQESLRPSLRFSVRKALENLILDSGEYLRNSQLRLVKSVVVALQRAANCAPLSLRPSHALNQLVGAAVQFKPREIFLLHLQIAVKRNQLRHGILRKKHPLTPNRIELPEVSIEVFAAGHGFALRIRDSMSSAPIANPTNNRAIVLDSGEAFNGGSVAVPTRLAVILS